MERLLNLIILAAVFIDSPIALAAENWVEVTANSTGDRILVDQSSIQRTDTEVRYWEYRDRRQSQMPSPEATGRQPVYGMMIYRSVNCAAETSRVQRLVLFNQSQQVIRRVNYEASGGLSQPVGRGTEAALRYVCDQKPAEAGNGAGAAGAPNE